MLSRAGHTCWQLAPFDLLQATLNPHLSVIDEEQENSNINDYATTIKINHDDDHNFDHNSVRLECARPPRMNLRFQKWA